MDTNEPTDAAKAHTPPFRVEEGDGTEPPRLIFDYSRFHFEDERVGGLQSRVGQLEALVLTLRADFLRLQAQLETRLK